jgi:hypothetical protein
MLFYWSRWGLRFFFYQGPGDLAGCSLPSNRVIISFTYLLKHNARSDLVFAHKFNLEAILCFCSNVFLSTNGKYKVLFDQGYWNLVGYSLEPLEVIMSSNCWFEPWELVIQHMFESWGGVKRCGWGKNGAKTWATRKYSLACLRTKLWSKCLWVGRSCWGKGIEFKLVKKTWACKQNSSCKFSPLHVKKCLSQILCLIAPPQRGKTRHHRGNKCQTTTLYGSYVSLSNGTWNVTCTSRHRMVRMWLYNRGWQKPKWKDPKTFNVETHVQANVSKVGVRKRIEPTWS